MERHEIISCFLEKKINLITSLMDLMTYAKKVKFNCKDTLYIDSAHILISNS